MFDIFNLAGNMYLTLFSFFALHNLEVSMDDQSELQKKVEEMEAFLGKILAFANSFIRKNGRVVSRDSGSHWSEVVYALDSFGGFNFHGSSGGQGSSTFDVVEHPSRRRLLSFSYWRDASDSQISIFCKKGSDWQARLCQTIENAAIPLGCRRDCLH